MSRSASSMQRGQSVWNIVLWLFSGLIILVAVAILQFPVYAVFGSAFSQLPHSVQEVVNMIFVLGDVIGLIMIPVGVVIGIVKITRK